MCHDNRVIRKVDYSALTQGVTRSELAAYKRRSQVEFAVWKQTGSASERTHRAWVIGVGVLLLLATTYLLIAVVQEMAGSDRVPYIVGSTVFVAIFASFLAHRLVKIHQLRTPDWKTWTRLDGFARANALTFSPVEPFPGFPGAVFNAGHYGRALNVVHSAGERSHTFGALQYSSIDRVLTIGSYEYTITTDNDTETYDWGFMALRLERNLPHMVLDAKANNSFGRTNLPRSFDKSQVLSLEGDFDRYFTLYCPKKYERDALYIFTPDLMALLVDHAAPFDLEVIDNWVFVYSAKPLNSTDPAVYRRLLHIADTVGKKAFAQTKRYSDARVAGFAENRVDLSGLRLTGWKRTSLRQAATLSHELELRFIAAAVLGIVIAFLALIFAR